MNNISVPRISLKSYRIFTINAENNLIIRIKTLFLNLNDVMKTVVVAKSLYEAPLRFMEI